MNFVSSSSQLRDASVVPHKLEFSLAHLCSSPSYQSPGGISTYTGLLAGALKYAPLISMIMRALFLPPDAA
eukprot:9400692-Heterocapsa_arctica.AAC.1